MSRYDWNEIQLKMNGNWQGALLSLVNIDSKIFTGKHQACPSCGGRDRFRFTDECAEKGDGGAFCNQCGAGDGMTWLMKLTGQPFMDCVKMIAQYLNLTPPERLQAIKKQVPKLSAIACMTPQEVACMLSKSTPVDCCSWQRLEGVGNDARVVSGKAGELMVVECLTPGCMPEKGASFIGAPCNVAFIDINNKYRFAGGRTELMVSGQITPGMVSPVGDKAGASVYLVSDYADAWHAHYLTGAQIWCCWSVENMWEVARFFPEHDGRIKAIVNRNEYELFGADLAGLDVLVPQDSKTIKGAKGIERVLWKVDDLLATM